MSHSLTAFRTNYIDEATKRALLGSNVAKSFGLPLSSLTTFKASALEDGPVELVPAVPGAMIVPLAVMCYTDGKLDADVSANFGWPAPNPDDPGEHDEPWLTVTPVLFFGGEDAGSLVTLPNGTAAPSGRYWPECVTNRPFAVELATGAARGAKKGKKGRAEGKQEHETEEESAIRAEREASARAGEEPAVPEPDLSIVVFYTAG
jgi:hypothetical protein